jgi:hypothetical protein
MVLMKQPVFIIKTALLCHFYWFMYIEEANYLCQIKKLS